MPTDPTPAFHMAGDEKMGTGNPTPPSETGERPVEAGDVFEQVQVAPGYEKRPERLTVVAEVEEGRWRCRSNVIRGDQHFSSNDLLNAHWWRLVDPPALSGEQSHDGLDGLLRHLAGVAELCARCGRPRREHVPGPAKPPRTAGHLGAVKDAPGCCNDFKPWPTALVEKLEAELASERERTAALIAGILSSATFDDDPLGNVACEASVKFKGVTFHAGGSSRDTALAHLRQRIAESVGVSLDAGEPEPGSDETLVVLERIWRAASIVVLNEDDAQSRHQRIFALAYNELVRRGVLVPGETPVQVDDNPPAEVSKFADAFVAGRDPFAPLGPQNEYEWDLCAAAWREVARRRSQSRPVDREALMQAVTDVLDPFVSKTSMGIDEFEVMTEAVVDALAGVAPAGLTAEASDEAKKAARLAYQGRVEFTSVSDAGPDVWGAVDRAVVAAYRVDAQSEGADGGPSWALAKKERDEAVERAKAYDAVVDVLADYWADQAPMTLAQAAAKLLGGRDEARAQVVSALRGGDQGLLDAAEWSIDPLDDARVIASKVLAKAADHLDAQHSPSSLDEKGEVTAFVLWTAGRPVGVELSREAAVSHRDRLRDEENLNVGWSEFLVALPSPAVGLTVEQARRFAAMAAWHVQNPGVAWGDATEPEQADCFEAADEVLTKPMAAIEGDQR